MLDILYVFVYGMLQVVFGSFIIRMIFSWINPESDNPIYRAAYFLAEIFVAPIRVFMEKHNLFQDLPIDLSFTFGYILVMILEIILLIF
ncbi:MAG: hypothetical protein E7675_06245 [Ruminococcaceae bacterium]|nr:hypothetical protein [Oscillospiraceae bacterium]